MCVSRNPTKWQTIRHRIMHLLGSLIMEKNEVGEWQISLARVSWWLAFLPAVGIWIYGRGFIEKGNPVTDISPNHFNTLVFLAAYNFGKKVADVVKLAVAGKNPTPQLLKGDGP
jgi:hypothetical protein